MAESLDIRELNQLIEQQSAFITNLTTGMNRVIVGQKHLIDSLLISLLSDGHILLEGVPGLAKTLAIKTLAQLVDADYSRIQFTPDLLPADVIGTLVYSQKEENFQVKKGPRVCQLRASRRNKPRTRKGAKCTTRSHARTSGNHWREHLPLA